MLSRVRLPVLALALAALLLTGCNGKKDAYNSAKNTSVSGESTELAADGLTYQVQLSRALNPSLVSDGDLFHDLPPGTTPPSKDEEWFAVWFQVENQTSHTLTSTPDFSITDTQGHTYKPLAVGKLNVLSYQSGALPKNFLYPPKDSIAWRSATQGAFLLFKLPYSIYQNRPANLHINAPDGSGQSLASVQLDL